MKEKRLGKELESLVRRAKANERMIEKLIRSKLENLVKEEVGK